jgi:hypothetical protein
MVIYGLLFLLFVAAGAYALVSFVAWARNPNRLSIARPLTRVLAVASVAWAASLAVPFVAEWLGSGADTAVGAAWLVTLVSTNVVAARQARGVWGPLAGGAVLAGAVWAAAIGIYLMHALGWQGLSLDDLQSDRAGVARVWIGALFFAPGAFALGFLLGLVSPHLNWRRETPAPQ